MRGGSKPVSNSFGNCAMRDSSRDVYAAIRFSTSPALDRAFSRIFCKDFRSIAIAAGVSLVRSARIPIASNTRSTSSFGLRVRVCAMTL